MKAMGRETIASQLPCKMKEGLLLVVVALGFNLPVLHRNLTTAEDNGDVLTHPARVNVQTSEIQTAISHTCSREHMIDSEPLSFFVSKYQPYICEK